MKTWQYNHLIDQRKVHAHLLFLVVAILTVSVYALLSPHIFHLQGYLTVLLLIFIYLEAFILLARKLFSNFQTDITNKNFLRRILSRFILFYAACFIFAFIIFIPFHLLTAVMAGNEVSETLQHFFQFEVGSWIKSTLTGLSLGGIVFLFIQWTEALSRSRKLKEENLIFQHETLKSQVNPHFLFNSLNTLSALISTNPEMASNFTHQLAASYRYILDNNQKNRVSLSAEIAFIRAYFELHKIRDDDKIRLSIKVHEAGKWEILPVSLQILIENAIKHNMATRDKPLQIEIFNQNEMIVVHNNRQPLASQLASSKLGLKNLEKRVELVTGKPLIIEQTPKTFTVKIPLIQ